MPRDWGRLSLEGSAAGWQPNSFFPHCTAISRGLHRLPRFSLHEMNSGPVALGPPSARFYSLQRGLSRLSSPQQPPLIVGSSGKGIRGSAPSSAAEAGPHQPRHQRAPLLAGTLILLPYPNCVMYLKDTLHTNA